MTPSAGKLGGWHLHYIGDEGDPTKTIHAMQLVPLNDLREHDLSKDCWCKPLLDPDSEGMLRDGFWSHNALDRREEYEEGVRSPS